VSDTGHILIVEDEPTLQRILGSVLTDVGHHVDAVASAEEAETHLQTQGVDLVLSDKNLPGITGLELLQKLRDRTDAVGRTPFVLVTGYPSMQSAIEVLQHDGDGYLVKPFRSLADVVTNVGRMLRDAPQRSRRALAASRARVLCQVLRDGAGGGELSTERCHLSVDDGVLRANLQAALEAAGATVQDTPQGSTAFLSDRVDDLVSVQHDTEQACAVVLVHGSPAFQDLVQLIDVGGGGWLDPAQMRLSANPVASPTQT